MAAMWSCPIWTSAATGKPTRVTSCLSPCRAVCLKSCGNRFTDSEGNVLDFVVDEAVDVAETVVHAVMMDRLKATLSLLSDSERVLVKAIFFEELSEREVGLRLGVTQSVVNKRKAKILTKLRKIMENKI